MFLSLFRHGDPGIQRFLRVIWKDVNDTVGAKEDHNGRFFSFDVDKRLFEIVRSVCVFLLEVCSFIFVGVCMILLFLRVFRNLFMSSSVGMYFCCCLIFVFWSFLVFLG